MSGAVVRAAAREDAKAIAELLNAHAVALHGEPDTTPAVVREWLGNPELEIRLAEIGPRPACYGDLMLSVDGERADLDVREHPERPGAVEPMLDELEAVAVARGATKAWAFHTSEELAYGELLRERGYVPIRHSFRMLIAFDQTLAPPVWPDGIAVRAMRGGEERATHAASQESFADHWGFELQPYESWARWHFESGSFDRSLNFLALAGEEIAGVCLCSLHSSGDPLYGWVGTLGVVPRWRRRGIGLALLLHAFAEFRARGCTRVGLGVDAESTTGALELYERAGMHVHRRQDTLEKVLPGAA